MHLFHMFGDFVDRIYPIELEIKELCNYMPASYIELPIEYVNGVGLRTKLR